MGDVNTPVYDRLLVLLAERVQQGLAQYGTPLLPHNGRDALLDAWQEAADLLFYLTQMLVERETPAVVEQDETLLRECWDLLNPFKEMYDAKKLYALRVKLGTRFKGQE